VKGIDKWGQIPVQGRSLGSKRVQGFVQRGFKGAPCKGKSII